MAIDTVSPKLTLRVPSSPGNTTEAPHEEKHRKLSTIMDPTRRKQSVVAMSENVTGELVYMPHLLDPSD